MGDASAGAGRGAKLADLLAVIRSARAETGALAAAAAAAAASQPEDAGAGDLPADTSQLAERLADAEAENHHLRETVAELRTINDDAVRELLADADELAAAVTRVEDLEGEAQALRELNARLADAATELAAMVDEGAGAAGAAAAAMSVDLRALEAEAAAARNALEAAETRSALDRDALLARIRALEVDLAEVEGEAVEAAEVGTIVMGGAAAAGVELQMARHTIEALGALAKRRGEDLVAAETAALSAAAEVAALKTQLAATVPVPSPTGSTAAGSMAAVRMLEAMVAEMFTTEELGTKEAAVRDLEAMVADMVSTEELGAKEGIVRDLEAMVADMITTEELGAKEAAVRDLEATVAEMADVGELRVAEGALAGAMARVRDLEANPEP